jgi:hypothetical protein
MDTFKDRQQLDDLYTRGHAPWEVWKANGSNSFQSTPQKWLNGKRRRALIRPADLTTSQLGDE